MAFGKIFFGYMLTCFKIFLKFVMSAHFLNNKKKHHSSASVLPQKVNVFGQHCKIEGPKISCNFCSLQFSLAFKITVEVVLRNICKIPIKHVHRWGL